jgi:transcription initiation factor TFIID subunit 5
MYVPPPKPPAKDGTPSSTAAEAKRVNIPPIPADVHARYLADLNFRQRLSATTLPSICLHTFLNAPRAINSMNVSNDGALVSAACSDSTVRVYDLRDPSIRQSTNPSAAANKAGELEAKDALEGASFYADGQDGLPSFSPLSASLQPYRRFDDPTHLPYSKLVGHSGPVYSTSFSPEGQHLLSASEDSTIRLWHLETKKNLVIYKGHNYPVWDVSFASVGFYFASASHDHTARLWATNHISPLRMFVGHASDVDVVRFHPNCNYLATASSDSTARLWDVQTGECVRVFVGHEGPVRSLAMDPAGRFMATGGQDGRVCVWDLGTGRQVSSVAASAQGGAVTALDYSADGELLAAGSMDYSLALIEPRKAQQTKPLRTYHTKRTPLHFLHFTPRNLLLAGGVFNAD